MRPRSKKRPMAEINIVPYVDVMLVLLVIFMVTAPLLTTGVAIELPPAAAKSLPAEDVPPLVVSLDADGKFYLNVMSQPNQPVDIDSVVLRLAAELHRRPTRPVLIRGDQAVPYGQVVQAMVQLQQAGAGALGLVTDPLAEQKG